MRANAAHRAERTTAFDRIQNNAVTGPVKPISIFTAHDGSHDRSRVPLMRLLTAAIVGGFLIAQARAEPGGCFRYGIAGPIVAHPPGYGEKGVPVGCVTGMVIHRNDRKTIEANAARARLDPPGGLLKTGQRIGPLPR
jgi:hypothetical protein